MTEDRQPGYDAVIPARVRYDPELTDKAKLLYGEIRALSSREGYCWATNEYFCRLYDINERTVRRLISALTERGHICAEVLRDPESQAVLERRLWVDRARFALRDRDAPVAAPGDKFDRTPPDKNAPTPPDKIVRENITRENSTREEDPPVVPPRGRRKKEPLPDWEPERFARFWSAYPKTQSNANQKKADARRAWNKLRPSRELMAYMGRVLAAQKQTRQWQEGVGVPYASTWINAFGRDEIPDLETLEAVARPAREASAGWADDPEVMGSG